MPNQTFIPGNHRPVVPYENNVDSPNWKATKNYYIIAQFVYWSHVERIAKDKKIGLSEARRLFHSTGILPARKSERKTKIIWTASDMIVAFMMQFKDWQSKKWDVEKTFKDYNQSRGVSPDIAKNKSIPSDQLLALISYESREDFPLYLLSYQRNDDLKLFFDDPIFGDAAIFEWELHKGLQDFEIDEMLRIAQSHEHIQEIDGVINTISPTRYSVHYPHPSYGSFQPGSVVFHNIPNCLTILGDGSPIFRLEVIDTESLSKYKIAQIIEPWWSGAHGYEYDFDFQKFGLNEGDEIDHETLLEILKDGYSSINTRAERRR